MAFKWLKSVLRKVGLKILAWRDAQAARKAGAFCEGRFRQTDEEFLAECGFARDSEAKGVALAIRRALAKVAKVDPDFIHASDVYPDQLFPILSMWGDMDWLYCFWAFEEQLGEKLPGTMPLGWQRASVKEMAADIYRALLINRGNLS